MNNPEEIIYASVVIDEHGTRETQKMTGMSDVAINSMEWTEGIDRTPFKNKCLVAQSGDTIYYRYKELSCG